MSDQAPSPQHAQEIRTTPPTTTTTAATTTNKTTTTAATAITPRPQHTRKTSQQQQQQQQTISTPLQPHRRHLSRAYSYTQPTTTPLPSSHHHQTQPTNLDPTFPSTYDSPIHFSPSKARAAAQASHQLAVLQRWLTTLLTVTYTDTDTDIDTGTDPASTEPSSSSSSPPRRSRQPDHLDLLSKWSTQHQTLTTTNPELAAQSIQWLEATMTANQLSDERRRLVFEAKKAELTRFEQCDEKRLRSNTRHEDDDDDDNNDNVNDNDNGDSNPNDLLQHPPTLMTTLLELITSTLTPSAESSLTSLSTTSILLGHLPRATDPTPLPTSLSQAVVDHTIRAQDMLAQVDELQILQGKLSRELARARTRFEKFQEVKKSADQVEEEVLRPQTARWTRETKQIAMKIQEYKDRVAVLERSRPGSESGRSNAEAFVRVEDVVELQDRVRERRLVVKKLEESVKTLNGLPPDLEASRDEVKRAKSELQKLKARREELFAALART